MDGQCLRGRGGRGINHMQTFPITAAPRACEAMSSAGHDLDALRELRSPITSYLESTSEMYTRVEVPNRPTTSRVRYKSTSSK